MRTWRASSTGCSGSTSRAASSGTSADPGPAAVLIGAGDPLPSHRDVLVNLGVEVPGFYDRFERVLEIVAGDAAQRGQSRERFKFYRDQGLSPETHKIGETSP
jgi:DNA polymerase III subunit chi